MYVKDVPALRTLCVNLGINVCQNSPLAVIIHFKMEVLTSTKGKPKLIFENHAYWQNYKGKKITWHCAKQGIKCKAIIQTNTDLDNLHLINRIREHNHDADPNEVSHSMV